MVNCRLGETRKWRHTIKILGEIWINNQLWHTAAIPRIVIRGPEPSESATVSAIPRPAASAKEVDTEERSFLRWDLPEKFTIHLIKKIYNQFQVKLTSYWNRYQNIIPFSSIWLESSSFPISACSSATKDVVILSRGTLNTFDTRLKTEAETPTAANSTAPV